jgi:hypothetical protein
MLFVPSKLRRIGPRNLYSWREDEMRNVQMNTAQHSSQRPVVGGIYHDKSNSSFVVLSIIDDKALLEYASGAVTSVDVENWQRLQPQAAAY